MTQALQERTTLRLLVLIFAALVLLIGLTCSDVYSPEFPSSELNFTRCLVPPELIFQTIVPMTRFNRHKPLWPEFHWPEHPQPKLSCSLGTSFAGQNFPNKRLGRNPLIQCPMTWVSLIRAALFRAHLTSGSMT